MDTAAVRWALPAGQRLVFEELADGIVLYDALVGGTHLINVTAAEALAVLEQDPGLTAAEVHARVLSRLDVTADDLPLAAVAELLERLAALDLACAVAG